MVAHCTFASDEEIGILAKGPNVLHCPTSNVAISSRVPPVKKMVQAGVKINLGTDSFAWNVNPSILSEAWKTHELTGISLMDAYKMTQQLKNYTALDYGPGDQRGFN